MKKLILIAFTVMGFSMAASAQETINEITRLNTLLFDGQDLTVGYRIGGGCATHETRISVELVKLADPNDYFSRNVFEVKVFDVTPNPDYCEALLYPTYKVNLKDMIQAEAQKKGLNAYDVEVTFPSVDVRIR
ncbi:MAG: hypothetical protein M9899_05880 [Bdellovibrionaceae bacterium]|nr:hypothetical protein [Pseudobdellovibrionaceae bacterium]